MWVWVNLMLGVPSGSLSSVSVSKVPSDGERVPSPVPSAAGTFTVLWGIDSMVVVKEQWLGGQENLASACPEGLSLTAQVTVCLHLRVPRV